MLEQHKVEDMDSLLKEFEDANSKRWEGLVIHKMLGTRE